MKKINFVETFLWEVAHKQFDAADRITSLMKNNLTFTLKMIFNLKVELFLSMFIDSWEHLEPTEFWKQ